MELEILTTLKWRISLTTPHDFLTYFSQRLHSEFKSEATTDIIQRVETKAMQLCKLAQIHYSMIEFRPSERAFASYSLVIDQLLP